MPRHWKFKQLYSHLNLSEIHPSHARRNTNPSHKTGSTAKVMDSAGCAWFFSWYFTPTRRFQSNQTAHHSSNRRLSASFIDFSEISWSVHQNWLGLISTSNQYEQERCEGLSHIQTGTECVLALVTVSKGRQLSLIFSKHFNLQRGTINVTTWSGQHQKTAATVDDSQNSRVTASLSPLVSQFLPPEMKEIKKREGRRGDLF